MKPYLKYSLTALATLLVLSLVVCGGLTAPAGAATTNLVVSGAPMGVSTAFIGGCEGSENFDVTHLTDLGINSYRIWGGMGRWEWVDDDGVYGSPTIAEIKANPNVINWSWWDDAFNNPPNGSAYHWSYSPPLVWYGNDATMLQQLKDNGIEALITLRQYHKEPEAPWALELNPPNSPEDWNEWWEHVFATVYYINVINDYQVDRWTVHNEPNSSSQGWEGTIEDYYVFVQYTWDAIKYVYDTYLPGRQFWVHAPVTVDGSSWPRDVLANAGDYFNTTDVHAYSQDNTTYIQKVHGWMNDYGHGSDPLWVSEWGTWHQNKYDSFSFVKTVFVPNLIRGSLPGNDYVYGNSIFAIYDWGDYISGVIGPGPTFRTGYYALRLAARGLNGARTTYATTGGGFEAITTQDANGDLYVTMAPTRDGTVDVDLSALATSGSCTVWHWSSTVMDEIVATPALSGGHVVFDVPTGAALVKCTGGGPPPPTDTPAPPTDTPEPQPTDTPGGPTETPAPTNTPGGSSAMHVADISFETKTQGPFYKVTAFVKIVDAGGSPVDSATVYGTYSGPWNGQKNGTTGADGVANMGQISSKSGGTWQFCVDDVVKDGWIYDSGANVETCDSVVYP
jgi:hypothetical protein